MFILCIEVVYNVMLPLMTLIFILLNLLFDSDAQCTTLNVRSLYICTIQLMRAYTSSLYNRLVILLIQVGYLGFDVSPTLLSHWSTLLFLLISIMYITPNTIYYHSHIFSVMIYTFSVKYTAWCLTLYHNTTYCWALSIYSYATLPQPYIIVILKVSCCLPLDYITLRKDFVILQLYWCLFSSTKHRNMVKCVVILRFII